jgi:hypothetical protein
MAYLQRVVNGHGHIDREYGVGRGRVDLWVRWPRPEGTGWEREAIELKIWRDGRPDPRASGLDQLDGYLERLGLSHGALVVFDRRAAALEGPPRASFEDTESPTGRAVLLVRL